MASKSYPWLKRLDRGTVADPAVCYLGPNARTVIDREKLDRLKAQIKGQGVLEPLLCRRRPTTAETPLGSIGHLQVWDGQRRLLAVQELRQEGEPIEWIPVSIHTKSDAEMMLLAAKTVTGKEPLDPVDEANMVAMLIDYGLEATQIAERLGMSTPWVNRRRSLQTLEPLGRDALRSGKITIGRAEELAKMTAEEQAEALEPSSSSSSSSGKGKRKAQGKQTKRPGKRQIRSFATEIAPTIHDNEEITIVDAIESILLWVAGDMPTEELRGYFGLEGGEAAKADPRQTAIPGAADDDDHQELEADGDDTRTEEQQANLDRVHTALGVPPSRPSVPGGGS